MERRGARRPIIGAPERLAVHRDHPIPARTRSTGATRLPALGDAAHEGEQAGPELHRVEEPEDAAERVVARDAVFEGEDLAQEGLLRPAEERHVGARLPTAEYRREGDHEDFQALVLLRVPRAWIGEFGEDLLELTPFSQLLHGTTR